MVIAHGVRRPTPVVRRRSLAPLHLPNCKRFPYILPVKHRHFPCSYPLHATFPGGCMEALPVLIVLVAPLASHAFITLFGSSLRARVATIGITGLAVSTSASLMVLYHTVVYEPFEITVSALPAVIAPTLLIDRLAGVMMVLIAGVSLVIHIYSRQYMEGDRRYEQFFALLSLLTFVLLMLVTSGHLLWLFVFWHAVTWLLRALLSFNRESQTARKAGRTTLRVQGFGDAALLVGFGLIYTTFGTFDLTTLFEKLNNGMAVPTFGAGTWWESHAVTAITVIIALSVMTKSAQFPFHIWLPGTIEAPTPVSAMLHAGIVNAGGFLVNRLAPLYGSSPTALYLLFVIGALTALIGALTMLTQSSIKRTLVYSTMGQMGYMVMECGLGAFALAIFHLCAHGLFKATLFLNSGSNIHKAREEFKLPLQLAVRQTTGFAFMPWVTGLAITLILPLVILLGAHGLVSISLFEAQGTIIFLFFAWVTSSQAIFSLYRLNTVSSWKVSVTMIGALTFIGLVYLWAGESFTHFLYPAPGQAASYFKTAAWPKGLFDAFVALSGLLVIAVWGLIYGRAHGFQPLDKARMETMYTRLYVVFLNGFYVEEVVRAVKSYPGRWLLRRTQSGT